MQQVCTISLITRHAGYQRKLCASAFPGHCELKHSRVVTRIYCAHLKHLLPDGSGAWVHAAQPAQDTALIANNKPLINAISIIAGCEVTSGDVTKCKCPYAWHKAASSGFLQVRRLGDPRGWVVSTSSI
jgi:hypothetical protein